MFRYNILDFKYVNYIIATIAIALILLLIYLIVNSKHKVITTILAITLIATSGTSLYYMNKTVSLVDKLNANSVTSNKMKMSIAVPKDSNINSLDDLANSEVLAPLQADSDNIRKLVDKVKDSSKKTLNLKDGTSYVQAYNRLLKNETKAIVLNSTNENAIKLNDPAYQDKIKKIYEVDIEKETNKTAKKNYSSQSADSLHIYISGIDTYGPIGETSRSDVNIIMSINKKTNKILLTTTPRDTYIPIADGGANQYDKLTHAGVYGVDASIHTLENLYGIKIDYYARINFTSFMKLIDIVGGVEVYNDQEFSGLRDKKVYEKGNITLNSQEALEFVRERYGLANGDHDRGKNQQKVMTALIKKLASPGVLINYEKIINELSESIQTDMPVEEIMGLANEQLAKQAEFDIETTALEGYGAMGLPSYAMPYANLYMMRVNPYSLAEIKTKMQETTGIAPVESETSVLDKN